LGFRRQLVGVVAPLAKAVEINPDEQTTCSALLALKSLVTDLSCLEAFLALDEFRSETLEVLHLAGDEREATDLLSCTTSAENALAAAQATLDASSKLLKNPPSVKFLAELFNEHSALDGEVTKERLQQMLPKVPIGPAKDIELALSGDKVSMFGFLAFAQRVYGTPTLLGWWPSLVEDTNTLWKQAAFQALQPPSLCELLAYYELGSHGGSGVTADVILNEVLPAMKQPVEGDLVEELFAETTSSWRDTPLNFKGRI